MARRGEPSQLSALDVKETKKIIKSFEQEMLDFANNAIKAAELKLLAQIHSATVPKKQQEGTAKALEEYRKNRWEAALTKANGNELEAAKILIKERA